MLFNLWTTYWLTEVRMRDAIYEAEQARLMRAAKGPRKERKWWLRVTLVVKSLLAILTDRRVDELCRRSLSTTPSPTWKMTSQKHDSCPACC